MSTIISPTERIPPTNKDDTMENKPSKTCANIVDVVVAGAGIGGLITALCLRRTGFSVRIYERAQILEPIGFSIILQPPSVKVLYELGLKKELDEIGSLLRNTTFYSCKGQFVYEIPSGTDAGYNWPAYSVQRRDLQQMLLRHVYREIGETSIRFSQKLIAFRSLSDYVEVDFVNPITNDSTTELAKVLVGTDGINSTVRKILYPNEEPLLWSGLAIWRGLTSVDKIFLDGQTLFGIGNPNKRFLVAYHVSNNLIGWNLVVRVEEPGVRVLPVNHDWNHRDSIENVLPLLTDMKLDFIDIHHLIKSSTIVNQFPMCDRDILPRWTHDRVTLLGDAAHPMYPFGANGASQTILDAQALVRCFLQHGATPQGLLAYDDLRRSAANALVLLTREFGPAKLLQIVDERLSSDSLRLSDVISRSEIETVLSKCKPQGSASPEHVNKEQSIF